MPASTLVIREAEPERDYERIAEIRCFYEEEPITAELLRRLDHETPAEAKRLRLVACEGDHVVACGGAGHEPPLSDGLWRVSVYVDPQHVSRGIGRAVAARIEEYAESNGAVVLETLCRATDDRTLRFSRRRGYDISHELAVMHLDLPFDPRPFQYLVDAVHRQGIRTFAFADTARDEPVKRALYDLVETTAADEPSGGWHYSYEEFCVAVLGAYWFDPRAYVLASLDNSWIGLSSSCEMVPGRMFATLTGVRREFRGRGIAQALKVLNATYASERGMAYLEGTNDTRNEAMIAINRKLGYQRKAGWYFVRRAVG